MMGFPPAHDHFVGRNRNAAGTADVLGNGLAQLWQSSRGTVVRPSLVQSINGRFHHIGRGIEIRLADLQMNDASALALQSLRLAQNLKRGFGAQPGHPVRET